MNNNEGVDIVHVDSPREREEQAFQAGFIAGWNDAYEVGYGRAHCEMAEGWSRITAHVRSFGGPSSSPHEELQHRRLKPGGVVYEARLARHGREYQGGPVHWETGHPMRESA